MDKTEEKNKKRKNKKEDKKKEAKKKEAKGKKPSKEEEIETRILEKINIFGVPPVFKSSSSRPFCDICNKMGHIGTNC